MPDKKTFVFKKLSSLHKNWSFPLWTSSVSVTKSISTGYMIIFTEEILNGKLHVLCSASSLEHVIHIIHHLWTMLHEPTVGFSKKSWIKLWMQFINKWADEDLWFGVLSDFVIPSHFVCLSHFVIHLVKLCNPTPCNPVAITIFSQLLLHFLIH